MYNGIDGSDPNTKLVRVFSRISFLFSSFKPDTDESHLLTKLLDPNNIQHNDLTSGYIF